MDETPKPDRRIGRLSRRLDDLMRAPYTKGLPEWGMFPDAESRRRAIKSIERGMTPRSLKSFIEYLIAVVLFLSVPLIVSHLIAQYALPSMGPWNGRIMWIMTLAGYTALAFIAIRRDMSKALRKQLVDSGIPICSKCGYDLRGLTAEHARCPECGREFEPKVTQLLSQHGGAPADGADSRAADEPAV